MREGCSVALMGLLLDTIPDWGLSLRVVFTVRTIVGISEVILQQDRRRLPVVKSPSRSLTPRGIMSADAC